MEPAMILCAAVAVSTLGVWTVVRAGTIAASMPDRLATSLADIAPSRALATALLAVVGFAAVPRSAAAEPIPPIVRLADEPLGPQNTQPSSADPATRSSTPATYEVRRGDSLWCIAAGELEKRTGKRPTNAAIVRFWPRIYTANEAVIGDDPDLILPGQRLAIPEP